MKAKRFITLGVLLVLAGLGAAAYWYWSPVEKREKRIVSDVYLESEGSFYHLEPHGGKKLYRREYGDYLENRRFPCPVCCFDHVRTVPVEYRDYGLWTAGAGLASILGGSARKLYRIFWA